MSQPRGEKLNGMIIYQKRLTFVQAVAGFVHHREDSLELPPFGATYKPDIFAPLGPRVFPARERTHRHNRRR